MFHRCRKHKRYEVGCMMNEIFNHCTAMWGHFGMFVDEHLWIIFRLFLCFQINIYPRIVIIRTFDFSFG